MSFGKVSTAVSLVGLAESDISHGHSNKWRGRYSSSFALESLLRIIKK